MSQDSNASPGPKKRRRRRRGRRKSNKPDQAAEAKQKQPAGKAQAPSEKPATESSGPTGHGILDTAAPKPAPKRPVMPASAERPDWVRSDELPRHAKAEGLAPEEESTGVAVAAAEEDESADDSVGEPADDSPARRSPSIFQAAVRYGMLRQTSKLITQVPEVERGTPVVVQTGRGTELGETLGPAQPVEPETLKENLGEIVRVASEDDIRAAAEGQIQTKADPLFREAQELIAKHKLPMKLTGIEKLLGGDRTLFYFSAEGRVDFRALVRDLARRVRGRVEMRQIGARDEAKLLGDRSDCGQPLCCRTWLESLEPIPMKFAKIQTATLDPSKISGVCGRLKCCLRYEYDVYVELKRNLPDRNSIVSYGQNGSGRVIDYHILRQTVTVVTPEGRREVVPLGEVTKVERQRRGGGSGGKGKSGGEGDGRGSGNSRNRRKRRRRDNDQTRNDSAQNDNSNKGSRKAERPKQAGQEDRKS